MQPVFHVFFSPWLICLLKPAKQKVFSTTMSRLQDAVCWKRRFRSPKATSSKVNGGVGYRNWKRKMDIVARSCGGWDGRWKAYVCFKFSIFTIFPPRTNIGHLKLPIVAREHFFWTIIFLGPMVKSSECTRYLWRTAIITFLSTGPKSALTCKHKRPSYWIERHCMFLFQSWFFKQIQTLFHPPTP